MSTIERVSKRRPDRPNLPVNHIALSVPDVQAATAWYTEVLGFRMLQPTITQMDRDHDPDGPIFRVYGDQLQKLKVAFLTSGNGVGIELFEFVDPPFQQPASPDYTRGGFFHICLTAADPDALCTEAVKKGAKRIGQSVVPWQHLGEDDVALYMQDPWGNTIELLSCSFEQLMANR